MFIEYEVMNRAIGKRLDVVAPKPVVATIVTARANERLYLGVRV
jgi:hypothetical protein